MTISQSELLDKAIAYLQTQRDSLEEGVYRVALHALRERQQSLLISEMPAQRRQVTLLLANLSGFKLLSDSLEAEEVLNLMNTLWGELDSIILAHGGRIDRHQGNTVMAIWGAGISYQDDPQQAVHAALALRQSVARLSQQIPIHLRVGIHTGYVLLGSISSTGEFIALGQSVKLVGLLEEAAQTGQVIISHDTYRHVRGIFQLEKASPLLAAIGKGSVTQTYRVLEAKPRAFYMSIGEIEGVEAPMIGRQAELEALQQTLLTLPHTRRAQVITLYGDAGLGKSRLLHEFHDWLELLQQVTVWLFRGRANAQTINTPYSLLYDLLADRFQIHSSDSGEAAREKLIAGMATFWGAKDAAKAEVIGQLIGLTFEQSPQVKALLSNAAAFHNTAVRYLADFIRAVQGHDGDDPIVILLEDAQWADSSSLAALQMVLELCADLPLLLVIAARPPFGEQALHWPAHQTLPLKALTTQESQSLVQAILQKGRNLPPQLTQRIIEQAEGNPFYIEEIIKMLLDERIITAEGDHWHLNLLRWQESAIPSTLTGVLQNRLDSLNADEQSLLQQAAVIGRIFWDQALYALNPQTTTETIRLTLASLTQRDFVQAHKSSSIAQANEYSFRHILLHDFIYRSTLRPHRQRYHRQAAEWLIRVAGERHSEYAERIAMHYEEAGERHLAAQYFFGAGERAYQTSAYPQATQLYQRTLHWLDADDPQRALVLNGLGLASTGLALYSEATSYFYGGLSIANIPPSVRANLLTGLAVVTIRQGHFEAAQQHLDEAIGLSQAAHDERGLAYGLRQQAWLARVKGHHDQSAQYAQSALNLYQQLNDLSGMISCYISIGNVLGAQGQLAASEQAFLQGLALAQACGDRWGMSTLLINLGEIARLGRNYSAAQEYYAESWSIAQQIGHRQGVATSLLNQGIIAISLGDTQAARHFLQQALGLFWQMQGRPSQITTLLYYAELALMEGQTEQAAHLVGMVQGDSALTDETRDQMTKLLARLEQHLDPTGLQVALAQGAGLEMDRTIQALLQESSSTG
jgi:class 3 adenylate cyclase/tetratricopeptide (TPR) repeat protein